MKIKLIRTGGFIPVIKAAEADVDISAREMAGLLVIIQHDPAAPRIKDGNSWELTVGCRNVPVDLEKVPDEYKAIFDQLKNDLKIIK
jgi:hypothetical protein